jgi:hypothetical protein
MRVLQYLFLILLSVATVATHAQVPRDYNVVWNSQSKNASESMPCGGGDMGLNVWVENGDLLIYAAKSGSFDENNGLMKAGRLRINTEPAIFNGGNFKQELQLQEGYITIEAENNGIKAQVKIWADVFHPVANITFKSNKNITATVAYESWRYQDQVLRKNEGFGNSWKWVLPKEQLVKKDDIHFVNQEIVFYHQNKGETIFDATVKEESLSAVKNELYNPLANLVFGGKLVAANFIPAGNREGVYINTPYKSWLLQTKKATKNFSLQLYLYTAQTTLISQWQQSLDSLQRIYKTVEAKQPAVNKQWWQQFWNRSFIHIGDQQTDTKSREVGRNFQLFRYMLASNSNSKWPLKFNGGLFTVDPVFTDSARKFTPDFRNWGGGLHTMQNQRLVYFPMIKNGDWDLLQPQFDFYLRILKNAALRSKTYWNHGGASFTEQMENFGLPNVAEYGQKRPANFDKGVEYNAWLEYQWDTVLEFCLMMLQEHQYTGKPIEAKIPFIESCLQFFDEHYQYLALQRGRKALDGNGKLILYPGSGAETFKMAYNANSTIAALQVVTKELLQTAAIQNNETKKAKWAAFLQRIPPINFASYNDKPTIAPAITWERINNIESPQLYPVYPWGIYGIGKPGLDTALNTWHNDTNVIKFRSHVGWKQDNIWAARLGLTAEAWRMTALKLQNSERRFPAFWGPGFDWVPDHNWGGSGMIGLQEMLLQTDGKRILLFPAWPKDKNVHFKLHAPYNTTVEAEWKDGKLQSLVVLPAERKNDVVIMLQ